MGLVSDFLSHPLTRGMSLDDPRTTELRRKIIQEKAFLRKLYAEWYSLVLNSLSRKDDVLELGSGAGFIKEYLPSTITSEVFEAEGIDRIVDACRIPFQDQSLDAIVLIDVFHHIPDVERFLSEGSRCLRPGGRLVMIEPWRTVWSEWVYTKWHHEPFLPDAEQWSLPLGAGALSGANIALPWIVFSRDRSRFEAKFPSLCLKSVRPLMPLAYLLSGGISLRRLLPGTAYSLVRRIERFIGERRLAMFALIEVERLY